MFKPNSPPLNKPMKKLATVGRLYRQEIFATHDNARCHWCKVTLGVDEATSDHVIPREIGGEDSFENLVIACDKCNKIRNYIQQLTFVGSRCRWDKDITELIAKWLRRNGERDPTLTNDQRKKVMRRLVNHWCNLTSDEFPVKFH